MANPYNFDDCLICNTVKDIEKQGRSPSETELKRAFQAQEDKQRAERQKPKTRKVRANARA